MNNYRRPFFSGRNGADELSVTLVILGVVLFLAAPIFDERIIQGIFILLGGVSAFFGIFRSLSKNVGKRRSENIAFVNFFRSESDAEKERKKREKEAKKKAEEERKARRKEEEKTHAFFKCPQCGKELRVPRGKGKIRIKCPNCGEQFIRKT
ncbi:MAG: hypothetical protein ACI4NB_07595 [Candidatus Ornithospirochaeta sp.]